MSELVFVSLGLLAGGAIAWFWASARARGAFARHAAELEGRARAAEGLRDELREQIERRESELSSLRSALDEERRARTEAQTRLEAALENLQEQKKLLDEAAAKLTDTFKGLSADALRSNNQAFLDLARQTLEVVVEETRGDIGKRQEAIDALIKPLQETLKRYEEQIQAMEQSRRQAYGSLEEQLRALGTTQQQLQRETGNLVTALRTPQVRGRWGEMTLHRVVELAGMSEHCDYVEQTTVDSQTGRLRPDMVIHLPADREIVVDAKVSLDAYLDALSAPTEEERNAAMARHARQVRAHMDRLAGKSYWDQFPKAPEFVVMFIPGESFFAAAADCDRSLIEDGMARQVVLATPTTLIALLRAVAYGWRQEQIARNARAISDLGKQLYERLKTLADHFGDVGKSLEKAITSYNRAVGSMESRVFPAARRFKELGAATGDEIPVVETVDQDPRALTLPDPSER
ncbi:MAG TPA: DNA recombination protein RmuC [candidate division Zixibacteria bacterium]|nr:DNA recombination protein RmuC [candidate division Zixibacteria bacterium]